MMLTVSFFIIAISIANCGMLLQVLQYCNHFKRQMSNAKKKNVISRWKMEIYGDL